MPEQEQVTPEIPPGAARRRSRWPDPGMGLVNGCVPDALLDETVSALARQLAGCSPAARTRTQELLEATQTGALDREAEAQVAHAATP